jgi:hypothetical protein
MSRLLPAEDERAKLLAALGELVAQRGHATLVRAPIVRPHPSFFPDVWTPDEAGVKAMARRLMSHVGLGAYEIHVTVYANEAQVRYTASVGGVQSSYKKEGAAAWFAGLLEDTCFFGVEEDQLEDVEQLAGALAHEVAHAWRHYHGLEAKDRQHEEQLTDLTTIFLGFGLLTTNNSFRSRSSGSVEGASAVHSWSVGGLGYLPPEVMSFLLAAQVVARGSERAEVQMLKRELRPTQAEAFNAALRLLEPEREALRERLGVPPPEQWEALPAPIGLPRWLTARPYLVEHEHEHEEGDDEEADEEEEESAARDGIVFRIHESRSVFFVLLGVLAMGLLAILVQSGWLLLLPALGWELGRRYPHYRCSDSDCASRVRLGDGRCPGCEQLLVGTLRNPRDRWDAEAEYWRQHGGGRAGLERELAEEAQAAPPKSA